MVLPEALQNFCVLQPQISFVTANKSGRCLHLLSELGKAADSFCPLLLGLQQLTGMDTFTWDCFAAPQKSTPLDYCVFCLCVKPAMVLPHWDAAETKCNWRCLERGLLGETRAVLVNPECRWHVHILTSLAAGGSCINFLSALTD